MHDGPKVVHSTLTCHKKLYRIELALNKVMNNLLCGGGMMRFLCIALEMKYMDSEDCLQYIFVPTA